MILRDFVGESPSGIRIFNFGSLFKYYLFFTFVEYSTENFRACLLISLVHVLLAPELVMRTQGAQIIQVCDGLMADLKNEGIVMLMKLVETFIRAVPLLGTETAMPILPRIFQ